MGDSNSCVIYILALFEKKVIDFLVHIVAQIPVLIYTLN